jgi:HK97 family phage major capsid protein
VPTYNSIISRASAGTSDALVPEPLSAEIIQELPKASAALSLMRKTQLSSKTQRLPVLDVLPVAYFVGGDTGMKQTSNEAWKNVVLVVEEIATIIPVPEAYMDDADVPIWSEVQPRMVEAVGALIDGAVFWGVNKPSTWGTDLYTAATASGNIIKDGYLDGTSTNASDDFGQSVAALGDLMAQTGYSVNGFASRPGLNWRLTGLRSAQGLPIYEPDLQSGRGGGLYGFPLSMVENGSWNAANAQLIAGDWSKSIIGIRKDISFKMFTEGVISNDSGQVILNLMQQDAVAMRLTMRMAYAVANPVTIMQPSKTISQRFPFGIIAT